ncbi:MAG: hypothetical protein WDA60_14755 [Acidimicrobiia bacterium]|jgi:hypothetical protein
MAAGGPVDPTIPLPDGERRGAPQPPADVTGGGALPGSYDPTIAVPPVGPPDEPGGPYGPGPGDGEDEPDNRKWLWAALAVLGVIVLGVVIALIVSGGGDGKNASTSSTSASSSTSTSTSSSTSTTSTTATTVPGAPVIASYASNPASTVACPNTSAVIPITLTWTTSNANGVTISIDNGATASFGANGSAARDFNCATPAHTYTLTAVGANNASVNRTITLSRQTPATTAPTTAPPTTTTTT